MLGIGGWLVPEVLCRRAVVTGGSGSGMSKISDVDLLLPYADIVGAWLEEESTAGGGEDGCLLEMSDCAVALGEKGPLLLEEVLEMFEEEERVE